MTARSIMVNSLMYRMEQNPDAVDDKGRPTTALAHLRKLASTSEGAFFLIKGCSELLSLLQAKPLAKACEETFQGMAFVRLIGVTSEMRSAINEISSAVVPPSDRERNMGCHAPTPEQIDRRIVNAISRTADAAATYCYSASMLAENVFRSSQVGARYLRFGDVFSLVSDSADAKLAAGDLNKARQAVEISRELNAPSDVVNGLVYTQRHALLRLAKSVLSVVGGVFALGALLFQAAIVSSTVLTVIAFASSVLACAGILYRQSIPNRPVEMYNYFIPV